MADAFGDELFSVFEGNSTTAAGTKKDKEKDKGKWKGPPGSADKAGLRFLQMRIIYHLNHELEKLLRNTHSFLMLFKERPFSVLTIISLF
uniref:Mtr4 exosome RNA helicase n=1 Tax=Nomascus leucogenys TaxID=61853 RepID=A0A2I3H5Y8_NOMLE